MSFASNVIAFRTQPANQPLRRPRILIRAAREGQAGWRRDRDLPRLLRSPACPRPGAALPRLRAEEEVQDMLRRDRRAEYDMHRHVVLMIAILAEMRAATAMIPLAGAVTFPGARSGATGDRETTTPARL